MRQEWSDDRLDHLSQRMAEGFRLADERADRIEQSVADLRVEMREGFATLAREMDARFSQLDERFKQSNERFDRIETRTGDIEQRLFQLTLSMMIVGGGLIGTLLLTIAGLFTSLN